MFLPLWLPLTNHLMVTKRGSPVCDKLLFFSCFFWSVSNTLLCNLITPLSIPSQADVLQLVQIWALCGSECWLLCPIDPYMLCRRPKTLCYKYWNAVMAVCIRRLSGRNLKRSQGVKQFNPLHFSPLPTPSSILPWLVDFSVNIQVSQQANISYFPC